MRPILAILIGALATTATGQQEQPAAATPLQKAIDEMVALAEVHSGLSFEKPPRVRAAKSREWRAIVEREFEIEEPRDLFEATLSIQGLYLAATDEVVLSPLVQKVLLTNIDEDTPRHVRERIGHHKATIAHEIVHALQQVHFGLPAKLAAAEKDEEILRYKFLIEGHAVLIEELIAEKHLGLEDFMLDGPYRGDRSSSYAVGHRYFTHVLRTSGMKGVHEKLANPPTFAQLQELAAKPLPPLDEDDVEAADDKRDVRKPTTTSPETQPQKGTGR